MDSSTFTKFLRGKVIESGKYVAGIPRYSEELLVKKIAQSFGYCCGETVTGYFYVLADLTIDQDPTRAFIADFTSPNPNITFAVVTGSEIISTVMGGNMTITKDGGIPPGTSGVTVISNGPAVGVSVSGPGITGLGIQTTISSNTQAILESATSSTSALQSGLACLSSLSSAHVSNINASKMRVRARTNPISVTTSPTSVNTAICPA